MAAAEESKLSDPLGERVIELIRQQKAASDDYNALLNKKVGRRRVKALQLGPLGLARWAWRADSQPPRRQHGRPPWAPSGRRVPGPVQPCVVFPVCAYVAALEGGLSGPQCLPRPPSAAQVHLGGAISSAAREGGSLTYTRTHTSHVCTPMRIHLRFHPLRCRVQDGLRENTRMTMKNLEVAVVSSRQPGYFHYHTASEEVRRIERENLLAKKLKEISDLQTQIDKAQEEIRKRHEARPPPAEKSIHSLEQFFKAYGRPDPVGFEPMRTEFNPSPKVYGGSKHYPSFKSAAVGMKRGRLTGGTKA